MEINSVFSVSVLLSDWLYVFSLHQLQLLSKNRLEETPVNFHRQILMLGTVHMIVICFRSHLYKARAIQNQTGMLLIKSDRLTKSDWLTKTD